MHVRRVSPLLGICGIFLLWRILRLLRFIFWQLSEATHAAAKCRAVAARRLLAAIAVGMAARPAWRRTIRSDLRAREQGESCRYFR